MSDLISRQAAIEAVGYYSLHSGDKLLFADKPLKELPSAQPERKKGKWEFVGLQMFVCSECKHGFRQDWLMDWRTHNSEPIFPNFCPNCGTAINRKSDSL